MIKHMKMHWEQHKGIEILDSERTCETEAVYSVKNPIETCNIFWFPAF